MLCLSCQHDFYEDKGQFSHELFQFWYDKNEDLAYCTKNVPTKGSSTWKANAFGNYYGKTVSLSFLTYDFDSPPHFNRETVRISLLKKEVGKHIVTSSTFVRSQVDGDVPAAIWRLSDYYESYVHIDELDTINHTVKGRFDLYFKRDEDGTYFELQHLFAEQINFLGGHFECKIY
jgi:hypothetical protein